MKFRFRFAMLLCCATLLLSGCFFDKIRLTTPYDNEVTRWTSSLNGLSAVEQGQKADSVWRSPAYSSDLRNRALSIAASRPGSQAFAARKEFALRYERSDIEQRKAWEALYWRDLDSMTAKELRIVASRISPAQLQQFPWNLVMLKAARSGVAPDNSAMLNLLSNPGLYANPFALGLSGTGGTTAVKSSSAALAIPLSGSNGTLGSQIAAGALAGCDYLRSKGKNIDLKIIDTSQANWQQQIQNLPPQFTMIGGPLGTSQLFAMKSAASGRALFALTSNLPQGDEGVRAWRFFTSPSDQVRALIQAASSIGITSFAVFAPADNFGRRMSDIFKDVASAQGYPVFTGSYTPNAIQSWSKEAQVFIAASQDAGAIFLPDGWKNMEMLISSLQYHGAHNRLFMGSLLWEQPLGAGATSNTALFSTAIFPGTWHANATGRASLAFIEAMHARSERPSDWSALGFDFVQFAAELSLTQGWSAASLNARLSSGIDIDWAGAPLHWNSSGHAQRKLFLFHPEAKGFSPANLSEIGRKISVPSDRTRTEMQKPSDIDRLADSITKN